MTIFSSVIACDGPEEEKPSPHSGTPRTTEEQAKKAQRTLPDVAHVPVGEFLSGSLPGEPGRRPSLEPLREKTKLGPFRIDAYPYPGSADEPPRVGVSQSEAAALCAERKGRLCTELEWERACRGSASSRYPEGDEPCASTETCVSGFEVARMTTLPEWTASTFDDASPYGGQVVVRGAGPEAAAANRRCAKRSSAEDVGAVGFRCCYGAPNAAHLNEPKLGPAYEETQMSVEELRELLSHNTLTQPLAASAKFFPEETARTVLTRGPGDTMGFTLTTSPVIWQPAQGSKFLVLAGHAEPKTSFVLAYHLGRSEKFLAGSFIMEKEPGPIALAYAASIRPRIHFSGCWGCPGETGKVLFRKPEEVVMLQP